MKSISEYITESLNGIKFFFVEDSSITSNWLFFAGRSVDDVKKYMKEHGYDSKEINDLQELKPEHIKDTMDKDGGVFCLDTYGSDSIFADKIFKH